MDQKTLQKVLAEALEPIKQDLARVNETLDNRVLHSVVETEMTLKSYFDRYEINQHNIERVDTRLTTVEDHLDIEPPEDLRVPRFSSKGVVFSPKI